MKTTFATPVAELPAGADELRSEVRDFLAAERSAGSFTPQVDSWIAGWDPEFSRKLGARGWLGMTVPEHFGGQGRSFLERYVVTEELLAAGAPVAAHWVADRQVGPSLMRHGSDYQRHRYLPGIARGETYFAIGMSEPEAGSDLAGVRTRATRVDGGWSISGTKVWTSGAHHCAAFFVLARSEPLDTSLRHAGLSQFIVDLNSEGIDIRPIRLLTGHHHFNEVVLDKVFVPDELVLGAPGDGWKQVTSELAVERSGPERILSSMPLFTDFVRTVRSNGSDTEKTGEIGRMIARAVTLRQMSLSVAGDLTAGRDVDVEAALVKVLGTSFEGDVVDTVSRLSDVAVDPESADEVVARVAEGLLHAPGFTLRGGTSEILRGVIAKGLGLR
ncbi:MULTISPECIES: acyl-CoA dehydrogenase family protein [Rhodococcus]|uniref:Acyl-CoA dehydrogenase family protein n=1 Tax=Rhodococcus oxybenzonivorans TaxID=1990687 RepID=A0AAE5A7K3_9NOCA|nr:MULTISPECIES: acyl-CoA dehydrogenase family protein [Rhodococcus]MDV7240571.1 acyl-CoA dehydrogenase family protein [Rhodococcus oxybenzonivorans]MDV7265734.1 acyl-CoA dehydrogenase family protein [Rhodococcus oxybenzonivorans]MDV7272844.1 acyl-CoA dehydrogenase family protein [Rhodococcus oxybenzonivorans]MDV7333417.1 acyl-CoA dehydrogenase family protein [Rhodococcus oxybenzonivorans]MDV7342584.1 acyl-CoA dehydrogenase family protein [Rhodococcus oxybenzonivorans]